MRLIPTLYLLLLSICLSAQYDHSSVFPDLDDQELFDALVSNYKPSFALDLADARDTLYRRVHLHNDSVRCVYSGLSRYLDLSADPSQHLFGNGNNTDINLEHSYPRSKGSGDGIAESDMHHLFPTRVPVNSARASEPFQELDDNRTSAWYYKDLTLSNPPSTARDNYSEDTNEGFEPREDFKGNVAKAAFYFYTMYREEADDADPDFFESQRQTLCEWHEIDPVDSLEWVRNTIIASYQDGKENPFVLDCRLARLYCDDISAPCRTVSIDPQPTDFPWTIYPNVITSGSTITIDHPSPSSITTIQVLDQLGKVVFSQLADQREMDIVLPKGIYAVQLFYKDGQVSRGKRLVMM